MNINDCQFIDNEGGGAGGAIGGNLETSVICNNTLFSDNRVSASGTGGGAYYGDAVDAVFRGCTFVANSFLNTSSGDGGGAIQIQKESALEIRSCLFDSNTSGTNAGAVFLGHTTVSAKFILSTFDGNRAEGGSAQAGAIYVSSKNDGLLITNCVFSGNVADDAASKGGSIFIDAETTGIVVNTLFYLNSAAQGGCIYTKSNGLSLFNCTLTKNFAAIDAGGIYQIGSGADITLRNTILWENTDGGSSDVDAQMLIFQGTEDVSYSCIDDGNPGSSVPFGGSGQHNIDLDPIFFEPDEDNYRLHRCSPALDAAISTPIPDDSENVDNDPEPVPVELTPELDLKARDIDLADIVDTGDGEPPYVDMGAYEKDEFGCGVCDEMGDMNDDGERDGRDVQPFVDCFLAGRSGQGCNCECGDYVLPAGIYIEDVSEFMNCLIDRSETCGEMACQIEGEPRGGLADCNNNGQTDETDILVGTSQDCNLNGIPDECDIYSCTDDWQCEDVNENGVPDVCEPDCNANEIPDDVDLAECDSDPACADCNENGIPDGCEADCNANGIPDDCDLDPLDPDGDEWVSADCDGNDVPDECDYDCDENGVPDACDIDPLDPDGDEQVAPDCNGNGQPDSCDIDEGLPFGELDCNENEIPDSCDIANCDPGIDPADCDCNENGSPDGCDIAAEISEDLDENGIPDECEQEMMMTGGGGESCTSGTPAPQELSEEELEAAREKFFMWCLEQEWGANSEYSGFEQFERMVEKKRDLGI